MEAHSFQLKSLRHISCVAVVLGFLLGTAAFAVNPIPSVIGPVSPQAVVPGSGGFTLTVYGANFVSGAVVNWNRQPRSTTFVSARELHAQILASDVSQPTAGYISVTNPAPGGGNSSSSYSLVEVHSPTAAIVLGRPRLYSRNQVPWALVAADFNNDGILDFGSGYFDHINVELGNGDGTFRHGSRVSRNYSDGGIAYGDFNNDGNIDLLFSAGPNGNQLQVSLGDGNGQFRYGSLFGNFSFVEPTMSVGDFNRDGKLDFAAGVPTVDVFLGNGNGTFHLGNSYGVNGITVATGDFNGDGKLDLVVTARSRPFVDLRILIGSGDGTFQTPRQISSFPGVGCASAPLASDFNGDGKLDLAVCTHTSIGILLGNGDGTFQSPVFYPIGHKGSFSFAAGDFNADGKTDLVVTRGKLDARTGELFMLLGNGDGTFQPATLVKLPGSYWGPIGIVPGDFNSDGLLDFMLQFSGDVVVYRQQ